jgi:hypothetical protein
MKWFPRAAEVVVGAHRIAIFSRIWFDVACGIGI